MRRLQGLLQAGKGLEAAPQAALLLQMGAPPPPPRGLTWSTACRRQ